MKNNFKKSFFGDVITLSFVPLVSQVLGLLLLPIITRIYSPDDFGLFNALSSVIAFLGVFSTLAYHSSILLPKSRKDSVYLLISCISITVFFTILLAIIIVFFKKQILINDDLKNLDNYIFLIPLFVFLHGCFQIFRYWNTRLKNFSTLAFSKVIEIIFRKFFSIGYGTLIINNVGGLIYSLLFASIFKNGILLFSAKNIFIELKNFSISYCLKLLSKYKKFPIFSLPSELLSRLPALLIVYFLLTYFDSSVLGSYSLAISVLAIPTVFLTSSIIEAFSPRVADSIHENNHRYIILEVYERIFSLTGYLFIILMFFGEDLFLFVFGKDWKVAGIIAQILAFRSLFEVITTPVLSLIPIFEKQELSLTRRIIEIIVTIFAFYIGTYYQSYTYTFILYSLFISLVTCFISYKVIKSIKFKFIDFFDRIKFYLSLLILVIISCFMYKIFMPESLIMLFIFLSIITLIYYLTVVFHDKKILKLIYNEK